MSGFKFLSNRRLHDKNTKAVDIAIDRIKTVAPIVQERYHNAFIVNGYQCLLYQKLNSGVKCSCTVSRASSPITPILDERGNAAQDNLQSLLTDSAFGVADYGTTANSNKEPLKSYVIDSQKIGKKTFQPENQLTNPLETDVESDVNDIFNEMQADFRSTRRCGICYGSGFVGGYTLHNGNRFILCSVSPGVEAFGVTTDQTVFPHALEMDGADGYVDFTITLPWGALSVDTLKVWNNAETITEVKLQIKEQAGDFQPLSQATLINFTKGTPVVIRVSDFTVFTHVELQFNMTEVTTYLEYPKFTKTGDLNVIDPTSPVQIIVSGLVYNIEAWDVIVDLHDRAGPRYWRVTDASNFQDRNSAIYGWEVNARLIQQNELAYNLPSRNQSNIGQNLTTKLPRF